MSSNITLKSDGTGYDTKVFAGDTEIKGITSINIDTIKPDSFITMHITILGPAIEAKGLSIE